MAELKTKILLRNDETKAWEGSSLKLANGEAAVEFTADGKAKLKIGHDNKTFAELPYVGGDEAQVFQVSAFEELGAKTANPGDMGIVVETISDTDKKTYTAYVFNGENWTAMDGNYDASNVYFDNDFVYTAAIGVLSKPNSSAILAAKGKNVKQVLSSILAKEDNPKTTQPSINLDGSTGFGEYEVGTKVNLVGKIGTYAGAYTYGPATNVTFSDYQITFGGVTADAQNHTFENVTVTGAAQTMTASASHTEGSVPLTNLGGQYLAGKIAEGKKTASRNLVAGYRKMFWGPMTADSIVDSAAIRALSKSKKTATGGLGNFTAGANAVKIIVAVPKGRTISQVLLASSMNADITDQFVEQADVNVEGANGYDATAYTVYMYKPASIDAAETYNITIA